MSFEAALAAVKCRNGDLDALDDLARAALEHGEERRALEWLRLAAKRSRAPLLWQWLGLLHRALDEHELALDAFRSASQLAPNDALIAHGHARVTLEAGLDAVHLFLRARELGPSDGAVLLGLAAARNAVGQGRLAADELAATLEQAPGWTAGYEPLAQLLCTLGERDRATEAVERAIARFPEQQALWLALFDIHVRREDYAALADGVARADAAGVSPQGLGFYRAVLAAELSDESFPTALFEGASSDISRSIDVWRIRHLLRVGEVQAAVAAVGEALRGDPVPVWPYAATAWRLSGDDRSEWLEGDPRLVQLFDLTRQLPRLGELIERLRSLHVATGEYLDQSVRGGTQTDGPLLSSVDPLIRELRSAIVSAVKTYVEQLPPGDSRHPLLAPRRDREIRFSGSWSVRLRSRGRHSNHVHSQGWISSALYLSLPDRHPADPADAAWFTIGEPPDSLGLGLPPWKLIEPKVAHLVLFPSWLWHGTRPFSEGERLTVAFDVRPPL